MTQKTQNKVEIIKQKNIEQIKKKLRLLMRDHFAFSGQNRILGDIFVECLIENRPLSFEELSKKTKYSLATISLSLKQAEHLNIFEVFTKPGSKKKYVFISNLDLLKNITEKIDYVIHYFLPNYRLLLEELIKIKKRANESLDVYFNALRNTEIIMKLLSNLYVQLNQLDFEFKKELSEVKK